MGDIRPCVVAGTWYPGTREALVHAVDGHLEAALEAALDEAAEAAVAGGDRCPCALIAPHAGLVYSGPVAAYAYSLVSRCRYAAVVLVGPSHFVGFDGVALWPRGAWDTPLGPVQVDQHLASAIAARSSEIREYPPAHAREHSLEMQLPFVARLLPGVPIVPMIMGRQTRATAEALGHTLADAIAARPQAADRPVLLIASSDLSHYHDARVAGRLDAVVLRQIETFDPDGLMDALEREPGHACGGGPMVAVLHAARQLGASRASVLRYADSGDVSGDKTAVVGYVAAGVW